VPPRIGYYGDDFTGASDTLMAATLAGLRTVLFLGVPTPEQLAAAGPLDCLGIAGVARSMTNAEMEAELEPVGAFFAASGVPVVHYKTCSTFDSAPAIGSVGVAVSVLRRFIRNAFVPIVGGQPNLNRYCLFGNLFAAAEINGPVHRIDRHPTMSRHPVTPMNESDLRLHFARQGLARIPSVAYTSYAQPPEALEAEVDRLMAERPDAILFDIGEVSHLAPVGRIIWQRAQQEPLLAVGPSSVVQALAQYWRQTDANAAKPAMQRIAGAIDPVFVLAGSLSPVTARQIGAATSFERVKVDATQLARREPVYMDELLARVLERLGRGANVLAHTAPLEIEDGAPAPGRSADTSMRDLAVACGEFLARLLEKKKLRRVGVAGGDTSSYAVKALDIWGLSYIGALADGAALCRAHAQARHLDGIELLLKGGQMGPPDVFERLLSGT
jgi:3-oxoisoapionate kinase